MQSPAFILSFIKLFKMRKKRGDVGKGFLGARIFFSSGGVCVRVCGGGGERGRSIYSILPVQNNL